MKCWGANPFLTHHLCRKSLSQEVGLMLFACYFSRRVARGQIIPDASPVQQITVPGSIRFSQTWYFLVTFCAPLRMHNSSLTRHLCSKSLVHFSITFSKITKFIPDTKDFCSGMLPWMDKFCLGVPEPYLTRHLCINSRSHLFSTLLM